MKKIHLYIPNAFLGVLITNTLCKTKVTKRPEIFLTRSIKHVDCKTCRKLLKERDLL